MRSPPAWEGSQLWTVPTTPAGEFPAGADARISGLDVRGYQQMRLVLNVGTPGGPADARLFWRFSVDGGTSWADTPAGIMLDGDAEHTFYGGWQDIPAALRQSVDVLLALFGEGGFGAQQVRVMDFTLDVRGLDQTSAARLLPTKITAAEIADPIGTELRSFSPKDIADIAGTGGGGSTQAFGSIVVAGQSTVVADAAPDTLTLVGSNGVAITTNAATDTVTIAPSYGSGANTVCQGNDARLSDARAPLAHTHSADDLTDEGQFYGKTLGGSLIDAAGSIDVADDAIGNAKLRNSAATSVIGRASGTTGNPADIAATADGQFLRRSGGSLSFGAITASELPAATTAAPGAVELATDGESAADLAVQANDSRLANARAPTAHATTHKSGGADAVKLDELAAPTDVTTLNASTAAHGLMPKGDGNAAHFYNGILAQVAPPYDILCGIVGKPSNGEVVLLFVAPRAFRIPANASGSQLKAGTAATGSSVFSIKKNGTEFLTATVAGAGTAATFASSQTDFAMGDVLKIVAPSSADATLADIAITLAATLL